MDRIQYLNFQEKDKMMLVGKALSSELRIQILKELEGASYNVNEIAERLSIPASSAAMHVKVLEEAGLIQTELRSAVRGSMKVCSKNVERIVIRFCEDRKDQTEKISMPIGNYVDYRVEPTCGIVSQEGYVDMEDEPAIFYNPRRTEAKLIWLGDGYLEYRFPNATLKKKKLVKVQVSAEVCAEDHEYNMDYPSDITLWMNDIEVGTYHCPSDFGGRKGKLNPTWWPDENTQYGMLKTWSVDEHGTYLDGEMVSPNGLEHFHMEEGNYISVKIGVKEDAKEKGGLNIFGDCFGDYPQDIVMELKYE